MSTRQPRRKAAATPTLPPTPLEQFIAEQTAQQRKAPKTEYEKLTAKAQREKLEHDFLVTLDAASILAIRRQYQLLPRRRYRADFAYPEVKLCIEVDGGAWLGAHGGHTSAAGMDRDRRRDAECMLNGWTVLRVTADMIRDGSAANYTRRLYAMLAQRRQGAA